MSVRILLIFLLCASAAWSQTADELVQKNLAARGGLENIRKLTSLRQTGIFVGGGGDSKMELAWVSFNKPGKYRSEVTLQGLTAVSAYDGAEAWRVSPFQGRKDPERMSKEESKDLARSADLHGPLVDYKAKGHKLEYLGTEDVDGTPAHKLRVQLKDGDQQTIYLDPDYFLEIRVTTVTKRRGAEHYSETDLGNYEKVAGVYLPFSYEYGQPGQRKHRSVTITQAEPNVELQDQLFQIPEKK